MSMRAVLVLLVMSVLLTVLTIILPVAVERQTELDAVRLGYPLPFFVQDFSRYTPLSFPQYFSLGSPWEDPFVAWLWRNFLVSYAIITVLILGGYYLIQRLITTVRHS